MSCLCLGSQSTGKTMLLKHLQNYEVTNITVPIETVGTNIVNIPRHPIGKGEKFKGNRSKEKDVLEIREIGGSMAPLWPSYYGASIKSIVFVIDSSNLFQVSISTVLLMEILSHEKLTTAKILVVLNKKDVTTQKKLNYLKFMMRLENIVNESQKRVTVEEVSALTGDGVENVRNWIFTNSTTTTKPQAR